MNGTDSIGLREAIRIAFMVIARWEVIATLLAFLVVWALLRYVANPWARDNKPARSAYSGRSFASMIPKFKKRPKAAAQAEPEVHEQDDEDFPED